MGEMTRYKVLRGRHIGPTPKWWVGYENEAGETSPRPAPGFVQKKSSYPKPGFQEFRGTAKVYGRDRNGRPLPDGDVFESESNMLDPVFNPPGFPPKFGRDGPGAEGYVSPYERRSDESAQDYANRLLKLALEAEERAKAEQVKNVSMSREPMPPAAPVKPSFNTPEFLAKLDGMRLQELIDFAASEEIDIAQVRGEKEVRKAIRAALDVRK